MQKILTLFTTAIFLLISNNQALACDYYEDEKVLEEIIDTGVYKLNVTGKVCSNDKKSIIPIKNGKAHGKAKVLNMFSYWVIANFKNGQKHGSYKEYYDTGILKLKVRYKNGKREGLYKEYHPFGNLLEVGNYKNGEKESLWKSYCKSGALLIEENFKNGIYEGSFKIYYESGGLKSEVYYINDSREGINKIYHENGEILAELYYTHNVLISVKCANGREWTDKEIFDWGDGLFDDFEDEYEFLEDEDGVFMHWKRSLDEKCGY